MLKYNNTHIFTGYLKQLLASVNIPTCKIYTQEFARYFERYGKEDPRIIESFDTVAKNRIATRVNYLKDDQLYNYFWNYSDSEEDLGHSKTSWKRVSNSLYDSTKNIYGLTKTLTSPGRFYDSTTHEYLGEFLRFIRDYHGVNLMSLYNCFNNKICNNLYFKFVINPVADKEKQVTVTFDSRDSKYKIYAIPVKLFSDYTIAIDSSQGIEMFCGLYSTNLDASGRATNLIGQTYQKVSKAIFKQPFLFDKLNVKYWNFDYEAENSKKMFIDSETITRWDIINREKDLKLFIKVPSSCKSSIVILEGNFKHFNNFKYIPTENSTTKQEMWIYEQNHSIINFGSKKDIIKIDNNANDFTPISKLQLLAFNTGESYPFADRLIEYLSGSAITSLDTIPDNIKRVQRVMQQNKQYFKIEGLWENKIQKIIYDYIINSGPIEVSTEGELVDKYKGYHPRLGHTTKSTLYDTLGYIDRDAEKWYSSWKKENNKATVSDNIQNVDIYEGLFDI